MSPRWLLLAGAFVYTPREMKSPTLADVAREIAALHTTLDAMHRDIQAIKERVNVSTAAEPSAAQIAKDALSIEEFVTELGKIGVRRSRDWVYDQIRLRRIKPLPLGKPYQLARADIFRLTKPAAAPR